MSWPSKRIVPAVGSSEPQDQPRGRRLAAAGLADDAERLAAAHVQRDVLDGVHLRLAAREDALLHGEALRQMLELDEVVGAAVRAHAAARRAARSPPSVTLSVPTAGGRRRGARPAPAPRAAGAPSAQGSKRCGQRGWNGQPGRRREQRRRRALDRHERCEASLDRRHRVEQAPRVRVLRLLEDLRSPAPYSMIRPAYMTMTEFAVSATTPRSWVTRITPMSNSRLTSSISSRICACTVTSSAVVGSSQIRIDRVVDERHRDHRALAHAARELVRVVACARLRVRDADVVEQLDRARPGALLADVGVRGHGLGDLGADAVHRVEARERVLEDHRDVLAADLPQLVRRQAQQVAAHEVDLARDHGALRLSSPMIARFETLLPEPDSPTTPSVSPRESVNETSRDGLDDAVGGREADRQARDVEQLTVVRRRCSRVADARVDERVEDVDDQVRERDGDGAERARRRARSAGPAAGRVLIAS